MNSPNKPNDRIGKLLATILVCFAVAIVVFGIRYFETQRAETEQAARDTLNAVADLKVAQIHQWREEILSDANWVLHGSTLGNDVGKLFDNPIDAKALYRRTLWLIAWQKYQGCSRVLLVDPTGQVLLSAPAEKNSLGLQAREFIARTLKEQQVLISDLHLSISTPGNVNMDVFVPVFDRSIGEAEGKIVGVLIIEIDPKTFLYPMLETWPTASKTAETLLVRRDGDEVVYLNDLRHRKDTALKLKTPVTKNQLPAVKAVLGETGIVEGVDYRGVSVLAALRKVPDSPWFIVAKQDQAEILVPLRQQAWTTGATVGALMLAILLGLAMLWWRREQLFTEQELTERKRAEATLRESEDKFKFFFEHSNVSKSITRPSGKLEVNQAFCNLLGYSPAELQHKSWQEISHSEDMETTELAMNILLSGKQDSTRFTKRFIHSNGSVIWADISTTLRRDAAGQPLYFITAVIDITAQIQKDEALRASESLLKESQAIAGLGSYEMDISNRTWRCTDVLDKIFGIDKTDVHTTKKWESLIHPDDRAMMADYFEKQVIGQHQNFNKEYRIVRQDTQAVRWVHGLGRLNFEGKGMPMKMCGTIQDITERKRAEEALLQTTQKLQEQNAALERFTYTVSHDLKSPLVTIKAFAGFLEKDIQAQDTPRIEKDLKFIHGATEKMARLLEELLDLSRIGRKMNPFVTAPLQAVVQEALDLVAGQITQRGVTIHVKAEPIIIFCDRPRLVEVFQNLVDNAVKFMGDQPVPCVEIGTEKTADGTVIFVRDNGIGIDPRHHAKLFGLFEKLDPHGEGTGIGLALVKRIVEVHGGKIWAESAGIGKGSTFRFTLSGTGTSETQPTQPAVK